MIGSEYQILRFTSTIVDNEDMLNFHKPDLKSSVTEVCERLQHIGYMFSHLREARDELSESLRPYLKGNIHSTAIECLLLRAIFVYFAAYQSLLGIIH